MNTTCIKGLDDLLAAGRRPTRLSGDAVRAFFETTRAALFGTAVTTAAPAEPTPAVAARPAAFPVDVFPAEVGRFVTRVASAIGCPVDFAGVAALAVSGAAIGASRSLRVKGSWEERPAVYAVVVSRPGTAKTPAIKELMRPIFSVQNDLYEAHLAALKVYGEGLEAFKEAKRDRDDGDPEPPEPIPPGPLKHIYVNDTTVESLAANLAANPRGLLLYRDELTAWVRSMDMYRGRGTDRQFFLTAWSGEPVKVDRKSAQGQPVLIKNPFVSVFGGIQPDLLDELEAEGGREDGFLHRILFSFPADAPAPGWTEEEISPEDQASWHRVVARLLNLEPARSDVESPQPKPLGFTVEGKAAFIAWYDAHVAEANGVDFPPALVGPWSKLKAYCARFALIIHLLRVAVGDTENAEDEGAVDAEDVRNAIRLCDYFKSHIGHVFPCMARTREDKQAETLAQWMRRKGLTRVTPRDIVRANVAGVTRTSDAEKLLRHAVDRGFGELEGDTRRPPKDAGPKAFTLRSS